MKEVTNVTRFEPTEWFWRALKPFEPTEKFLRALKTPKYILLEHYLTYVSLFLSHLIVV